MLVAERKRNSFNFVQFLLSNSCMQDVVLGINELLPWDLPVRVLQKPVFLMNASLLIHKQKKKTLRECLSFNQSAAGASLVRHTCPSASCGINPTGGTVHSCVSQQHLSPAGHLLADSRLLYLQPRVLSIWALTYICVDNCYTSGEWRKPTRILHLRKFVPSCLGPVCSAESVFKCVTKESHCSSLE